MTAPSPPRVRLVDRLGPGGQPRERPFVIGVLADLGGTRPFPGSGFRTIDRETFDEVLRKVGSRLKLRLTDRDRLINLELEFGSLASFDPAGLLQQVPELLLSQVLHHPDFLRLESAWRGLHYLVREAAPDEALPLLVLDARRSDLIRDLASDGAGGLFGLAGADGGLGSDPCGLLVADYELDLRRADDLELLRGLAEVGASVHTPVIAAAAPGAFGLESWAGLAGLPDPARRFTAVDYAAWKSFREAPESRFAALTLPRALARPGAGDAADADERAAPCWMSAAWGYAAVAARAFREHGWFAHTSGPNDGATPGLPPPHVYFGKPPLTDGPTGGRDLSLAGAGFLQLAKPSGDRAAFLTAATCHQPPAFHDPAATARAAVAARLDVLLCVGRFVQALSSLAAGEALSRGELTRRLGSWLADFTAADRTGLTAEQSAARPLGVAAVELKDGPGGSCVAKLRLRLDHQFAEPVELTIGVPVTARG